MSHIPISISCGSPRQFGAHKHWENSNPGQSFLCSCVVQIVRPGLTLIEISEHLPGIVPQLPSNELFLYFNGEILCHIWRTWQWLAGWWQLRQDLKVINPTFQTFFGWDSIVRASEAPKRTVVDYWRCHHHRGRHLLSMTSGQTSRVNVIFVRLISRREKEKNNYIETNKFLFFQLTDRISPNLGMSCSPNSATTNVDGKAIERKTCTSLRGVLWR